MQEFEIIYAKRIIANDFFDAVEKSKNNEAIILSVAAVPPEEEDDVFDE